MGKLLRIDMKKKSVAFEKVLGTMVLFGGRGSVASILSREVDPACDPLGPLNKLIICPGLFADTAAPCSGRISIGGKSPFTGTIKEANAGGMAAKKLTSLGIYAIVVEDAPEDDNNLN